MFQKFIAQLSPKDGLYPRESCIIAGVTSILKSGEMSKCERDAST